MRKHVLLLILLLVAAVSVAPWLQVHLGRDTGERDSDNVFKVLFGEGRRLFANQMFVEADVYMHSGLYPSIFDQASARQAYAAEEGKGGGHAGEAGEDTGHDAGHDHDAEAHDEHEHEASFLGKPHDWFEAEGRHFMVTKHTHLHGGREREILPWLKLAADLNPQEIETYTVAAFWLTSHLNRPKEAEEFLREGLRANPHSYEILFELGRIYNNDYHQPDHARNLWKLALRRWNEYEAVKKDPDTRAKGRILVYLAESESEAGNYQKAIHLFEEARSFAPESAALDKHIQALRVKLAHTPASPAPVAH